ncbi:cell surface protein [Methanolobus psychrophilus R15]|nr:cell surface protein [Methanolobus psychrophilus R15]
MNIKQAGLIIGIAILIIIAIAVNNSTADAAVGTETKISDSIHATSPVVYGNWIVWVDAVGVHGDFGKIFMRNVSSGEIRQLKTPSYSHSTEYYSPAIHEDRVVWVEETLNGSIIYFYNISTNETSPLVETSVNPNPAIYNDLLVWQDDSNGSWDIYMYNIATGEEQQITKDSTSDQMNPVIYEDIIVWQDDRNYNEARSHENVEYISEFFRMLQRSDFSQMWDIYMYNISTGEEKQITTHVSNQINPAIYGDTVVWQDYRNWNWDIYMYNLSSEEMRQITTNESVQWEPAIYKDKIVWVDNNRTEFYLYREIYMYNISTEEIIQITDWGAEFDYPTETYWRGQPSIYENKIVWSDERGGMETLKSLCSL